MALRACPYRAANRLRLIWSSESFSRRATGPYYECIGPRHYNTSTGRSSYMRWSQADADHLEKLIGERKSKDEVLAEFPERTWSQIRSKTFKKNFSRPKLRAPQRLWSEGDSSRLLEMKLQGKSKPDIMARFPDRNWLSITQRWYKICPRTEKGIIVDPAASNWSTEELEQLVQLRNAGFGWLEISKHFPRRKLSSIIARFHSFRSDPTREMRERTNRRKRAWTSSEVQRLLQLRFQEKRNIGDIARELNRSIASIATACTKYSPHGEKRRRAVPFSDEEMSLVKRLRDEGFTNSQISDKLPGRTKAAIENMMHRNMHVFGLGQKRTTQEFLDEGRAIVAMRRIGLSWSEIATWFPNEPMSTLNSMAFRWRQHCAGAEELGLRDEEQEEKELSSLPSSV